MPNSRSSQSSGTPEQLKAVGRKLSDGSYRLLGRGLNAALATWAARRPLPPGGSPGTAADTPATVADAVACYRLLLGRDPDPGGLEHHRRRLSGGEVTRRQLVEEFLGSVEFARAHPGICKSDAVAREAVATTEGFRLFVNPTDYAVGHTVARTGSYEPEVSATLRTLLRKGMTFVDVGANIGWFSLLGASLVGPTGKVVAIEPNPANVALLHESAQDNGFDYIDVLAVAVGDHPGAVALETDGSNGRIVQVDEPPAEPVTASFVVAAYPLDTLLSQVGVSRVDVMKIDIEGAEPLALRGATEMMAVNRPVLISEFYPLALSSSPWGGAEGYLKMLRSLGYDLSVIGAEGDLDDGAILAWGADRGREQVDLLARPR